MATITFPTAAGPVAVATQAVYTRAKWSDAWTLQSTVWCTRVTRSTGESISAAQFRHRFGYALAPGGVAWGTIPVIAVNPLSYVRVDVAGSGGRAGFTWWGMWKSFVKSDVDQIFTAVGLEQALDQPCQSSPWWDGTEVRWSHVGLAFNPWENRGETVAFRKNRSAEKHTVYGSTVYVFEPDESVAEYWSTRDIVETLLAMAAPLDATGDPVWIWTHSNLAVLPDFDQPTHATDGVTYLALIRSIVTRFRLLGWTVEPNGTAVQVRFFSFAETAISLKDVDGDEVGTIPANAASDALVMSADQSSRMTFSIEASNVCDQVIVTGDRRRTRFTLRKQDDTWESLWEFPDYFGYMGGAIGAPDYPADPDLREARDRDARNSEQYRAVFSHFGPAEDWDQTISDPTEELEEDEEPTVHYLATEPDPEDPDEEIQLVLYRPLLRFDDDPVVYVRTVQFHLDFAGEDRWQRIDQLGRSADLEQLPDHTQRRWSAEVRSLPDKLGIEIRVQGEQQHVLAEREISGFSMDIEGAVDWGQLAYDDYVTVLDDQDLLATCTIADPRPVEVRWPADSVVAAAGDLLRRVRIEDQDWRLIYVVPGTVIAVDPETCALQTDEGGYLTDDRDEMLLIAQRTYAWHRVPRYALQFATGWVDGSVAIGRLILQATDPSGTFPVLSVVSEVTVDFPLGTGATPGRPNMSVVTAFGEFDARVY
jgi:hypothetical protein